MRSGLFVLALLLVVPYSRSQGIDADDNNNATTTTSPPSPKTTTHTLPTSTTEMTTKPVPVTTAKPSGTPKFVVKDGNKTCLMMQATITACFKYPNMSEETTVVFYWNATSDGSCDNDTDMLLLSYMDTTLNLTFDKTKTDFSLTHVAMHSEKIINTATHYADFSANVSEFKNELGKSYKCDNGVDIKVDTLTLKVKNLKVQAFMESEDKDPDFGATGTDCDADTSNKTDAIVPIVVGAALAAMVLIVLIGYCIGRRRQNAGYQQMNA